MNTSRLGRLFALGLVIATAGLLSATPTLEAQGVGRQGGAPAPRGRSITLGDVTAFETKDNVITVSVN